MGLCEDFRACLMWPFEELQFLVTALAIIFSPEDDGFLYSCEWKLWLKLYSSSPHQRCYSKVCFPVWSNTSTRCVSGFCSQVYFHCWTSSSTLMFCFFCWGLLCVFVLPEDGCLSKRKKMNRSWTRKKRWKAEKQTNGRDPADSTSHYNFHFLSKDPKLSPQPVVRLCWRSCPCCTSKIKTANMTEWDWVAFLSGDDSDNPQAVSSQPSLDDKVGVTHAAPHYLKPSHPPRALCWKKCGSWVKTRKAVLWLPYTHTHTHTHTCTNLCFCSSNPPCQTLWQHDGQIEGGGSSVQC